jgi:hypothetical protein
MEQYIGRYSCYNKLFINITDVKFELNDIIFYLSPDYKKEGWWIGLSKLEMLINLKILVRVGEYKPLLPKNHIPNFYFNS